MSKMKVRILAAIAHSILGLMISNAKAAEIPGTGSISGTVEARKPFKAAQVYIRNVEKRILYMVYSNRGPIVIPAQKAKGRCSGSVSPES